MDNKPFYKRIPWWGWLLIILFAASPILSGVLGSSFEAQEQYEAEEKARKKAEEEAEAQEFHQRGEKLNDEVGDLFLTKETIFIRSHLEDTGDYINLELTVSDDWYYLPEFQRERMLEDAWQAFNLLTVKHGLREADSMPWDVFFIDRNGKRVAEKGWW